MGKSKSETNMAKSLINRNKFEDIKRYDRQQMDKFVNEIYNKGFNAGVEAGHDFKKIEYQLLSKQLKNIKGLGAARIEAVINIIKSLS